MTKTTAELATRVLLRLGVIASDETPTTADSDLVQNYYASAFQELENDGIGFWTQTVIPERVFEALADLIAGRIGPDFGVARPDLEESGTARLFRLASSAGTGATVTGPYF